MLTSGRSERHVSRTDMGIRIQPLDIDIPEDEPFKYDLLGRR